MPLWARIAKMNRAYRKPNLPKALQLALRLHYGL